MITAKINPFILQILIQKVYFNDRDGSDVINIR